MASEGQQRSDEPKREFFNRVQPKLTAFAISLQEQDGLSVVEVGDSLMSAAIAIAVGASGRVATATALLGIAQRVMDGAYDNAVEMSGRLN